MEKTPEARLKHNVRQEKHEASKKASGFKRLAIWIPPGGMEDYLATTAMLKKKWADAGLL